MTSKPESAETQPIRPGEEVDTQKLTRYLHDKIEEGEHLVLEQFPGGHSNLTYLLKTPQREYVLRRGPLGPVAPKAHDMGREYAVLKAVHPHFAAAPEVFHLCPDPSILGAVFLVMERRHGVVIRDHIPAAIAAISDHPQRISRGMMNCLVELHAVDIEKHGLVALGKPAGFLERQVHGWFGRWLRAKTEEIPEMDRLIQWLTKNMPASPAPTLVHNDFKLDNVMLDSADCGRVEAVLDWEMATVGDPLVDLGLFLCYWGQPADPGGSKPTITGKPGWLSRAEIIDYYAKLSGRDVANIDYYEVFAIFKLAVVLQQIFFRFHCGQTQDERFKHFDGRVRNLIRHATGLI
ncbi:MAG TPA: phosphotransferase family protein [Bryobacteraceae bacterium]|nr:phosphotransferase family protein [Bryobacteraceae bacterium]